MKDFRKTMLKFFSGVIFIVFVSTTFICGAAETQMGNEPPLREGYFKSFSGIIKEINDLKGLENEALVRKQVLVENQGGAQVSFVVSKDTYFLQGDQIYVGADVIGFYRASSQTPNVSPPQYFSEILALDSQGQQIKADFFEHDLLSADGSLKIRISPATELVWRDGSPFKGVLGNKRLIVFYSLATRSIPAQTIPSKVIVFENSVQITNDVLAKMDIMVNGQKIQSSAPYLNEDEIVMVPLKPIAASLGFNALFDEKNQSGVFAESITFKTGEDNYFYLKKIPLQLGAAPEFSNKEVYVPLNFFTELVRLNNAYLFENQIVINNDEKME